MTLEELKKALEAKEGKELLAELLADETRGLKDKNAELLETNKRLKKERTEFSERLEALEDEKRKADDEKSVKAGDIEKLKKSLEERHEKEVSKYKNLLNSRVLDSDLSAALDEVKVHPDLKPAVIALLKSSVKYEVSEGEDGSPKAKFDGKSVKEFATEWAGREESKRYLSAATNGGGGSQGANDGGKANVKTMKRGAFDSLSSEDQMKTIRDGTQIID